MRQLERLSRWLRTVAAVAGAGLLLAAIAWLAPIVTSWPVVLGLLIVALAALAALRWLPRLPRRMVLELDLDQAPVEVVPDAPAGLAVGSRPVLREVVDALDGAADDDRVQAVLVRLGSSGVGLARAQELHDALAAVRRAGTRTVAYAETFGAEGNATADYLVAAACEEVVLQPGGEFGVVGVAARSPYVREALDRLSLEPQLDHRREYKAAKYRLTERSMPAPDREATAALVTSALEHVVDTVAEARGMAADAVQAGIDEAPLGPTEARAQGFVDRLDYRDRLRSEAERGGGARVDVATYTRRRRRRARGRTIAVVYATGTVTRGRSRPDLLSRGTSMGSDDVATALEEAAGRSDVAAIVVRVDSPGGSAVASESIWRAVARARELDTPVVASFGDVAASGGYYLACGADRIVAQPTTITGSIGVVGGKLVTGGAWERLGVTWGHVGAGANASWFAPDLPFDDHQWARFQTYLDDVYELFKRRVAEGRDLDPERVEELARGRVWIGCEAAQHGLVDDLGGLREAVAIAQDLAGLPAQRPARVEVHPQRSRLPWRRLAQQRRQVAAVLDDVAAVAAPLAAFAGRGELWWDGQLD